MPVIISKRKEEIINCAQNLFKERGYASTSIRDIAKEVGIEPASLYSHFKSKDDILQYICLRIANEFFEMQYPVLHSVSNPTEKLKRVIAEHVNVILQNLDAASVFFNEWRHLKDPDLSKFVEMRERYEDGFKMIIDDGVTSGDFKNIDIHFITRLIFSVINGVHEWYQASGKVSPDEMGQKMSEFILNGIAIQ